MGQKKQINVRTSAELHREIVARAHSLEETHGGYLRLIGQWWFTQGCPPVSENEARLLAQTDAATKRPIHVGAAAK